MPSPGLMNETAVEIEMRKQMRERCAARMLGLGEDFRDSARESIERMLTEMFVAPSYRGRAPGDAAAAGEIAARAHRRLGRAGR
jgi:hypothetical protein